MPESGEPVLNVYVELYSNLADSMPLLEVPDYVARTDSSGFFPFDELERYDLSCRGDSGQRIGIINIRPKRNVCLPGYLGASRGDDYDPGRYVPGCR